MQGARSEGRQATEQKSVHGCPEKLLAPRSHRSGLQGWPLRQLRSPAALPSCSTHEAMRLLERGATITCSD